MENKGFVITLIAVIALAFFASNINTKVTGQQVGGSIKPQLNCTMVANSTSDGQISGNISNMFLKVSCPSGYKYTGGTCSGKHNLWSDVLEFRQLPIITSDEQSLLCEFNGLVSSQYILFANAICCRIK